MTDVSGNEKPVFRALLGILVLLVVVIGLLGWGYFSSERNRIRRNAATSLGAIADLKTAQLVDWKRERIADANVLMANRAALGELARVVEGSAGASEVVKPWLETLCAQYGYHAALVLDREGRVQMGVGHEDEHVGEHLTGPLPSWLEQRKPIFSQLRRGIALDDLHIDLLVPLMASAGAPDSEPFGVLVLRIGPADFLFPLIQTWPTPSRSAETLLVRRDGDDVLFLNELRHRSSTAMTLRIPASRTELPAARAVQGFSGSVRGSDYRGVPVLAAVRAIPHSDWHLVSKIDVAEVDAPLHRVGPPILACVLALIAASGTGLGFLWRKQEGRWLERQVQLERQRAGTESELRQAQRLAREKAEQERQFSESVISSLPGVFYVIGTEGRFRRWNTNFETVTGYSHDEMATLSPLDLFSGEDKPLIAESIQKTLDSGAAQAEAEFVTKSGARLAYLFTGVRVELGGEPLLVGMGLDISARKQAMAELEASEARFRNLLTLAPLPLAHVNSQGDLIYINNRFTRLFGYDLNDVPNLDAWWPAVYPDADYRASVQKAWNADVERASREGTDIASHEYTLTCKDGTVRHVEIGGVMIGEEFLATFVDRTAHRAAEENLKEFLAVTDNVVTQVDATGAFTFINNAAARMFGVPAEDCIGRAAFDFVHAEDRDRTAQAFGEWTGAQRDHVSFENRQVSVDGQVHEVMWTINPRYDQEGSVASVWSMALDVTQQRRSQRALAENERRYRGIFHTAPVSIWEEDWSGVIAMLDGLRREAVGDVPAYLAAHPDFVERALKEVRILDVNAETMSMFGAADKAQLLSSLETVFATPDTLPGFVGELCALAAGERFYKTEMRLCTVQGIRIHVLLTMAFPDAAADSGMVLVSLMDLTERKQHEEAQTQLTEELARKNRELAQVVYVASHDLRSPLVNVQGFSRELKASLADMQTALDGETLSEGAAQQMRVLLEEDIPESLTYILSSVSQMDRLLSGLLAISRLGRTALTMDELDMTALVGGVVDALDFQLREQEGRVDIDALPPCRGDAGQLEQVFQNLIGNAVKYAAPNRPAVIRISGKEHDGEAVYCVQDNGRGIAPQHQEKVFELFHRLSPGESEGDGLGLTIVRTIIDRHNGRAWLESVPGEGSRFHIAVPMHDGNERAGSEDRALTTNTKA